MRRDPFLPKGLMTTFWVVWFISGMLAVVGSGLVVYILYRIATHPW